MTETGSKVAAPFPAAFLLSPLLYFSFNRAEAASHRVSAGRKTGHDFGVAGAIADAANRAALRHIR